MLRNIIFTRLTSDLGHNTKGMFLDNVLVDIDHNKYARITHHCFQVEPYWVTENSKHPLSPMILK